MTIVLSIDPQVPVRHFSFTLQQDTYFIPGPGLRHFCQDLETLTCLQRITQLGDATVRLVLQTPLCRQRIAIMDSILAGRIMCASSAGYEFGTDGGIEVRDCGYVLSRLQ